MLPLLSAWTKAPSPAVWIGNGNFSPISKFVYDIVAASILVKRFPPRNLFAGMRIIFIVA